MLLLPGLSLLVWTARTAGLFAPWLGLTLIAWGAAAGLFFHAYRLVHGHRPPLRGRRRAR